MRQHEEPAWPAFQRVRNTRQRMAGDVEKRACERAEARCVRSHGLGTQNCSDSQNRQISTSPARHNAVPGKIRTPENGIRIPASRMARLRNNGRYAKAMPRTGDNALAIGFSLLPIDFFCMSDIMSLIEYERFQCPAGSMPCGQLCRGKRESGASPGRSGHCKRGEPPQKSIVPQA